MKNNWKFSLFFVFLLQVGYTQDVDSLVQKINVMVDDTGKVNTYDHLIDALYFDDPKQALEYSYDMAALAEKISFKRGTANAYAWIGYLAEQTGDVKTGLAHYFKAIPLYQEVNQQLDVAACYNNIAAIYHNLGNTNLALEYHYKSLKLKIDLGESERVSVSLNNIGLIYASQGKIKEAMELYYRALFISENKNDSYGLALSLDHIGAVYLEQKHYQEALENYSKALVINHGTGDKYNEAHTLQNMGVVYREMGKLDLATKFLNQGLRIAREIDDLWEQGFILLELGYINFLNNRMDEAVEHYREGLKNLTMMEDKQGIELANYKLGELYFKTGNFLLARQHLVVAYDLSEELGYPSDIRNASFLLYSLYEKDGDDKKALELYKRYTLMKDSVHNDETRKAVLAQKLQFEFSRDQYISEQKLIYEKKMEDIRVERRNFIQYSVILLFIFLIFGLVFSFGFIKIPKRLAQGIVFISLLFLFEFVLVYTDPFFEGITRGEPVWKLLINSVLALSIFPLHSFLEKRLSKKVRS